MERVSAEGQRGPERGTARTLVSFMQRDRAHVLVQCAEQLVEWIIPAVTHETRRRRHGPDGLIPQRFRNHAPYEALRNRATACRKALWDDDETMHVCRRGDRRIERRKLRCTVRISDV